MKKKINEVKARELVNNSDAGSKRRSVPMKSTFEKDMDGEAYFSVPSATRSGKTHIVIIAEPTITDETTLKDLKRIAREKDIKVACSCEAFLYWGYKYITYKNKAGIDPEGRPPVVRNPKQKGMLCKHIIAVLASLFH